MNIHGQYLVVVQVFHATALELVPSRNWCRQCCASEASLDCALTHETQTWTRSSLLIIRVTSRVARRPQPPQVGIDLLSLFVVSLATILSLHDPCTSPSPPCRIPTASNPNTRLVLQCPEPPNQIILAMLILSWLLLLPTPVGLPSALPEPLAGPALPGPEAGAGPCSVFIGGRCGKMPCVVGLDVLDARLRTSVSTRSQPPQSRLSSSERPIRFSPLCGPLPNITPLSAPAPEAWPTGPSLSPPAQTQAQSEPA